MLVVYKQVEMQFDEDGNLLPYDGQFTHTIHTTKSQTFKPSEEPKTEHLYKEKDSGKETANTLGMAH